MDLDKPQRTALANMATFARPGLPGETMADTLGSPRGGRRQRSPSLEAWPHAAKPALLTSRSRALWHGFGDLWDLRASRPIARGRSVRLFLRLGPNISSCIVAPERHRAQYDASANSPRGALLPRNGNWPRPLDARAGGAPITPRSGSASSRAMSSSHPRRPAKHATPATTLCFVHRRYERPSLPGVPSKVRPKCRRPRKGADATIAMRTSAPSFARNGGAHRAPRPRGPAHPPAKGPAVEPRLTGIRAVLFDLGDTLFRLHPMDFASAHRQFARLLSQRCGLDVHAAETATADVSVRLRETFRERQQSGSTAEPSIAESALPLLSRFGADARWLANALDEAFGEADIARWDAPPGTPDGSTALHRFRLPRGLRLEHPDPPVLMRRRLAEFGLLGKLAEVAVFSVEVGQRKPGERYLPAALEALDMAAGGQLSSLETASGKMSSARSRSVCRPSSPTSSARRLAEAQPRASFSRLAALWEFL